jgi:hypothetical protein
MKKKSTLALILVFLFLSSCNSFDSDVKRLAEITCEIQKGIPISTHAKEVEEITARHITKDALQFSEAVRKEMENCK